MTRPRTLAGLAMAALGSLALLGCDRGADAAASPDMVQVSVRSFEMGTLASGELTARTSVELRSGVDQQTTIVDIVDEGSRVSQGDVLVRLNSDNIDREIEEEENQLTEAKLNLDSAIASYEIQVGDNEANLKRAQEALELAELALEQWIRGDDPKKIHELKTKIEAAEREVTRMSNKVIKNKELLDREFLSLDEFERDEIDFERRKAELATAEMDKTVYLDYQQKKDRQEKLSDVDDKKRELERVKQTNEINLKRRESDVANRRVQYNRRLERLQYWQDQLAACTVTASTEGLVIYGSTAEASGRPWDNEGPLAVGSQVRKNDLLIVLPDTSAMVAEVKVHESLAGRIRPGQTARVKVEAAGDQSFAGRVESIGVLAEGGGWRDPNRREYTVRVAIDASEDISALKPSMRCESDIVMAVVEDAVTVPVQAVFARDQLRYVYVPQGNGKFIERPVNLGRRSDLWAEIRAGLGADETVLVREPSPAEVLDREFGEEELKVAGYTLEVDENTGQTKIVRERPSWGSRPARRSASASGRPTAAASAKPAEVKPEPERAAETETIPTSE
ncbi:MAG: efflux RND transporter periplasmic adaptor subunit [Planctomycetota bacterium]